MTVGELVKALSEQSQDATVLLYNMEFMEWVLVGDVAMAIAEKPLGYNTDNIVGEYDRFPKDMPLGTKFVSITEGGSHTSGEAKWTYG